MNIDPHKPASADESGVRELYRELPQPQPSAELDQAILLAARQALQNDKLVQLPPRPWHKRLLLPLSIAATVVLSFGVVLRMSHEQAAQVVQLQHADIVQSQETAAPVAAAPAPQPIEPAPRAESTPAAAVAGKAPAPIVLPRSAEQKASPPVAQPVASDAAKELAPAAPPAAPLAAPVAAPEPPPAPMRQAAPVAGESAGRVADSAAAGLAAGAPAAAPAAAAPMTARKALRAHEAVAIDPAISEIRRLLASGERDQARAALLRYRAANPEVELPADLRALLDETAPATPAKQ